MNPDIGAAVLDPPRETTLSRPQWTVVFLVAAVVIVDQATKWWAWRDVSDAEINFGGDPLVGSTVGAWFANRVTGGLLDLVSSLVLTAAVLVLARNRYPVVLRTTAALAVGGWSSNLLDRLGLHCVTAPGSIRGAVDFIHVGAYYLNVADFVIIAATVVFLPALGYRWMTAVPAGAKAAAAGAFSQVRARVRIAVAVGATGLIVAVALGVANYGGITAPGSGA
ncbi:signal peptidase II [Amycolatopsis sp. NBC_01488]|uniref:signal peptidase II n=1 Tax=Amycolatopsis sp. NBC_01488 TaxID=2903563 RepID=UPI002E27E7C1|nr:signal peptidase II [Amycolatopsis sp. NBC_01488]